MNAQLYEGNVIHKRHGPTPHAFRYAVHFLAIPLESMADVVRHNRLFSYNHKGVLAIHDSDYLTPSPDTLRQKFDAILAQHGVNDQIESVVLVTSPRTFGYVFNPVSFFLGFDRANVLRAVVAEVNNTFGERHLYCLDHLEQPNPDRREWYARAPKSFHVSPFNDMNGEYRFQFCINKGGIGIHVDLYKGESCIMQTKLAGRAGPFSDQRIATMLLRHPLRSALTFPRIVSQAIRLKWSKRMQVHARPEPVSSATVIRRDPSAMERFAMQHVIKTLRRMQGEGLCLVLPDGTSVLCGNCSNVPKVHVRRYRFFSRIARGGAVAFGECYTDGDIDCDDLTAVLTCLIKQREHMNDGHSLLSSLLHLRNRALHLTRRNTKRRSRHNIHAHYDLSNAFFKQWLDPTMTYSAGLYDRSDTSLESAQRNKLNALIDLVRLEQHHHLLEIGTGWGSFAIQAATRVGCRVTTVTISEEQFALARQRVDAAGLSHLVDVQLCDYRDLTGTYDRIVSIEMIEAVGHRYLATFFEKCDELLAPDGLLAMQAITIPDHRYERYRYSCDWIQKHIFPGGHLPSLGALNTAMHRRTRLQVEHVRNIGLHYARTLRDWRVIFDAQTTELNDLGFDDVFIRKWRYYLSYCEAGLGTCHLNTLHLLVTRPNNAALVNSPTNPHQATAEEGEPEWKTGFHPADAYVTSMPPDHTLN
ncbi:MAG: cyclopropane-fatty-acyl-phospholipid synthase [Candidatus Promineifilaceae bacterium]|jgi:cyclopropane-fatty-acyl-phospholipid synthase